MTTKKWIFVAFLLFVTIVAAWFTIDYIKARQTAQPDKPLNE